MTTQERMDAYNKRMEEDGKSIRIIHVGEGYKSFSKMNQVFACGISKLMASEVSFLPKEIKLADRAIRLAKMEFEKNFLRPRGITLEEGLKKTMIYMTDEREPYFEFRFLHQGE